MLCPFRTDTIVDITEEIYSKSITKREVYPQCEGDRCPYYRCVRGKYKHIYEPKREHCKLVDKQIKGV